MREIKFRAWDKNKEKMTDVFSLTEYAMDNSPDYGHDEFPGHTDIDEGEAVLMQFTGLQDKNGKDIYEGDILTLTNEKRADIYSVSFHNGSFTLEQGEKYKLCLYWWNYSWGDKLEVIGNVYMNPELVKVRP